MLLRAGVGWDGRLRRWIAVIVAGFFILGLGFRRLLYMYVFGERLKIFKKVQSMIKWCFWKMSLEGNSMKGYEN